MTKHRVFKRPPLYEAVFDIRITPNTEIANEELESYHKNVISDYPIKQVNTLWEASLQVKLGESPVVGSKSQSNGYLFKSEDSNNTIQFRKDGFTLNYVNNYKNWLSFSHEAKKHLSNYLDITKPKLINRIALRYINIIEIPLPIGNFKEYILTVPEIAKGLPQSLTELQMRIVIPDEKRENIAIITEGIDQNRLKLNNKILPYIFDIDVFRIINMEPNVKILDEYFESIKKYIDRIFLNSITEKAIKLFN